MVAVLLSLFLIAARHPMPPLPPPPRGPVGVPQPGVLHALEGADSVIVYTLGDRSRPGGARPDLFGREVMAISRATPQSQFHAQQILSDVLLYEDAGFSTRYHISDVRRSRYAFQFVSTSDTVTALMLLAEPCVEIRDRSGLAGRGYPDAVRWSALVRLASEIVSDDPAVQTLRVEPAVDQEYAFVDSMPRLLDGRVPEYPAEARKAEVEGTVLVQARVGIDGRVMQARILHSIPALDAAAMDAVSRWRFRPALARGKPVTCWVAVPVTFGLH